MTGGKEMPPPPVTVLPLMYTVPPWLSMATPEDRKPPVPVTEQSYRKTEEEPSTVSDPGGKFTKLITGMTWQRANTDDAERDALTFSIFQPSTQTGPALSINCIPAPVVAPRLICGISADGVT